MSRDYIDIGPAPCDEECVQVSPDGNYLPAMRTECNRFIELIRKKLGPEAGAARLSVKTERHDFGSYLEVVCYFDTDEKEGMDYAFRCESEAPSKWDQ